MSDDKKMIAVSVEEDGKIITTTNISNRAEIIGLLVLEIVKHVAQGFQGPKEGE